MRFADFLLHVLEREQQRGIQLTKEHGIIYQSLNLVESTGSLCYWLSHGFVCKAINRENLNISVSRALHQLGLLFLYANEGNTLDDEALELSFSWNICPEWNPDKLLDTVVTANHIALENLKNVSQGILQRTAFYPLFAVLAKVLESKTLAELCEEYCVGPVAEEDE